jgi:KUP system potassium uptake protein
VAPSSDLPHGRFWALTVGSVGVAYGDIGTSPLYAFREAVVAAHGVGIMGRSAVLGVVSLILWSLILVVTVKYIWLLLRADNHGEGGTFALMALAQRSAKSFARQILLLGMAGAAFFYGDAIITPAISVVSAVEGLKLVHPEFAEAVIPISIVMLIGLFCMQSRGTHSVARLFGPIMVVWFVALSVGGLIHIADSPDILHAINPIHGLHFAGKHGLVGLSVLGLVFLAVTGAEALYADLGHFGRKPIQTAWVSLVLPALLLNYMGQGALVLSDPTAIENSFYRLYPGWALIPMVLLATLATIIASQAVITGAYSLTRQAIQLGLLPRLAVRHTSEHISGQIYMPQVNWFLLLAVIVLVVSFRTSSNLATAYGIAVTSNMILTSIMTFFVVWRLWGWSPWRAAALLVPLICIEFFFFTANMSKVLHGGWLPLLLACCLIFAMITWRQGYKIVERHANKAGGDLEWLARKLDNKPPTRVPGTAVFLTSTPDMAPTALMHNLKHNRILHERNIILAIKTEDVPRVPRHERVKIDEVSDTFIRVVAHYGFMETPNVPKIFEHCRRKDLNIDMGGTSFFLSRRTLKPTRNKGLPLWQEGIFIWLTASSEDATTYFGIPTDRVVEIGTQVEI